MRRGTDGRLGWLPGRALVNAALAALVVVYAGYVIVLLAYGRSVLLFPFDYDQGEGFELYDAIRLARFENIYLDNAQFPYYSSNYPPVYRVMLVPLVWIFGPHLWVGRIVAFVATLAIGVVIFVVARRAWRTDVGAAAALFVPLLAGMAFYAANFVYQVAPLARAHLPMMLFAFLGIACIERAFRDGAPLARWAAAGVTLLMIAGFTKLQAVDALAAGFAFLLLRQRAWFAQALIGCAVATIALVLWIDGVSGGQFWLNVVAANVNEYDIAVTWQTYSWWLQLQWPLLACALLNLMWELRDAWRTRSLRPIGIWSLYFVTGSAMGMLTGKWGAGPTYLIASIAAACVCTAQLFARVSRRWPARETIVTAAVVMLFAAQAAANVHMPTSGRLFGTLARVLGVDEQPSSFPPYPYYDSMGYTQLGHLLDKQDTANAWALVEELRKHPAPIWTEEAMFNLNAGRDVVTNPTQLLNLSKNGMLDTRDMIARIERREFGAIVLKAFFYPGDVKDAFGRAYDMVGSIRINGFDYYLLLPKKK
jgi:hypothetical protein